MAKKKATVAPLIDETAQNVTVYRHNKGVIQDNAIQALLHDRLFRQRIEKKRKGKGSYQRKAKYAGKYIEKPDYQIFGNRDLIIGFLLNNKRDNIRGHYVSENSAFIQ